MKVSKTYLGKLVEVTWKDPAGVRAKAPLLRGRAALATWREFGVIDDITDGVVRLVQSAGLDAGEKDPNEFLVGWIPEELIEEITVYTILKEGPPIDTSPQKGE